MIVGRRLQRSRKPGARMPESAVYVGRTAQGIGRFGNPFRVGGEAVRLIAVGFNADSWRGRQWAAAWLYARWLAGRLDELAPEFRAAAESELAALGNPAPPALEEIRRTIGYSMSGGCRDVVCWCATSVDCHGDILRAVALGRDPVAAAGTTPHLADNFRWREIQGSQRAADNHEWRRRNPPVRGWSPW